MNEDTCKRCLAFGGKGTFNYDKLEKGYELPVEYTFQCKTRQTCEKIVEYRKKKIAHYKEISGMGNLLDKSLDNFQVNDGWQQYCKEVVQSYLNDSKLAIKKDNPLPWLLFMGKTGTGKTHLCSIAPNGLMELGKRVTYMTYPSLVRDIKMFNADGLVDKAKHTDVLFLDDLFKFEDAKCNLELFEILDYRYKEDKCTIISTEKKESELMALDEAMFGRIAEKASLSKYCTEIADKDNDRNYRLK